MSPSLGKKKRNRLSSGKLVTSFLLLNSSHCGSDVPYVLLLLRHVRVCVNVTSDIIAIVSRLGIGSVKFCEFTNVFSFASPGHEGEEEDFNQFSPHLTYRIPSLVECQVQC